MSQEYEFFLLCERPPVRQKDNSRAREEMARWDHGSAGLLLCLTARYITEHVVPWTACLVCSPTPRGCFGLSVPSGGASGEGGNAAGAQKEMGGMNSSLVLAPKAPENFTSHTRARRTQPVNQGLFLLLPLVFPALTARDQHSTILIYGPAHPGRSQQSGTANSQPSDNRKETSRE